MSFLNKKIYLRDPNKKPNPEPLTTTTLVIAVFVVLICGIELFGSTTTTSESRMFSGVFPTLLGIPSMCILTLIGARTFFRRKELNHATLSTRFIAIAVSYFFLVTALFTSL